MAGITLSVEQIDVAHKSIQQAIGIAQITGATGESQLADNAIPHAMWAIHDLLENAMNALKQGELESQA